MPSRPNTSYNYDASVRLTVLVLKTLTPFTNAQISKKTGISNRQIRSIVTKVRKRSYTSKGPPLLEYVVDSARSRRPLEKVKEYIDTVLTYVRRSRATRSYNL